MAYRRPHNLALPPQTTLDGKRYGGQVHVTTGKPPKLRFRPGTIIKLDGEIYEVIYAYRVRDEPHEWFYSLEERREQDAIGAWLDALGCGQNTPRVVYEIFRDHEDAMKFFTDIPMNAHRWTVPNKKMLQGTVLR